MSTLKFHDKRRGGQAPAVRAHGRVQEAARRVLLAAALIITATSIVAPVAEQASVYQLSEFAYGLDWFACHQLPSRSFWLFGRPLGVCIRCTGLYLGVLAAAALHANGWVVSRRSALAFVLFMLVHVGFQASAGIVIDPLRFMTGIMGGAGLWWLLILPARKEVPLTT